MSKILSEKLSRLLKEFLAVCYLLLHSQKSAIACPGSHPQPIYSNLHSNTITLGSIFVLLSNQIMAI
jgi:hypothetical protein